MTIVRKLTRRFVPPRVLRYAKKVALRRRPSRAAEDHARHAQRRPRLGRVVLLEDRLDVGYTNAALSALRDLVGDPFEDELVRAAAALAIARWELRHGDPASALEHLERSPKNTELDKEILSLAADCCCELRDGARALSMLSPILDLQQATASTTVRLGSARSLIDGARHHGSGWLATEINRLYDSEGLALIHRRNVQEPPSILNLTADPPRCHIDDLLVSVIVPAFECSHTIEASLHSILDQSWRNLEVIVVNADSSDTTIEVVSRIASTDSRVRIVTPGSSLHWFDTVNKGVEQARGEFVTVHSGRDWAHPQRLEVQAAALIDHRMAVACGISSLAVSIDELLHVSAAPKPGERLIDPDFGSVLYRRRALDRVGFWDLADGAAEEYFRRVEAAMGPESVVWVMDDVPLILRGVDSQATPRSLDFGFRYREAFRWWHQSHNFEEFLPFDPYSGRHPFAPTYSQASERILNPRVLVIGDLSEESDATAILLKLAERAPGAIGVIHVPGFESGSRRMLPSFYELAVSETLVDLSGETTVTADLVLLTSSVLESPPVEGLPSISAPEACLIGDGTRATVSSEQWSDIPIRGIFEPGSARLEELVSRQ